MHPTCPNVINATEENSVLVIEELVGSGVTHFATAPLRATQPGDIVTFGEGRYGIVQDQYPDHDGSVLRLIRSAATVYRTGQIYHRDTKGNAHGNP